MFNYVNKIYLNGFFLCDCFIKKVFDENPKFVEMNWQLVLAKCNGDSWKKYSWCFFELLNYYILSRFRLLAFYVAIVKILALDYYCWTPIFRWKGVLWFHHCRYVSMSGDKRVLLKTTQRIFLELLMKLGCLKGKKLTQLDFREKFSFWG